SHAGPPAIKAPRRADASACCIGGLIIHDAGWTKGARALPLPSKKCREDSMGSKIAIVGTGAVGGYAGAHMAQAREDVTFIDPWPEHVEHMRKHGLRVTHAMNVPEFTVPVRALHITDAQQLAKEAPVDIAFVCMKSYDTAWATMLIRQYLAPDGYVVSLQNCINEET